MTLKDNGIVLKMSTTVHGDRLLYILTERHGRVQVFDRSFKNGGKKRQALDLFSYCEFVLYENATSYSLNNATLIEGFYKLREDIKAATLASYFAQLCLYASQDSTMISDDLLPLLLNGLYLLTIGGAAEKVKTVFEWKIAQISGFTPALTACEHADFDGQVFFSVEDGKLYCEDCLPVTPGASAHPADASMVKAIGFILSRPPAKAFSFNISLPSMQRLGTLSEEYLMYHSAQTFSALELYKTIG